MVYAAAGQRIVPRFLHVAGSVDLALTFAGRTHHRLDDARIADAFVYRGLKFPERIAELVRARRQAERLRGKTTDTFAIHRQARGTRGRDHAHDAGALELFEHRRRDRFDLRHDDLRALGFDQLAQLPRVVHRDRMRMMRDLLARRVGIAIDCNRFDTETLQRDQHFLAEFARAEQHDARGGRRERRAEDGGVA